MAGMEYSEKMKYTSDYNLGFRIGKYRSHQQKTQTQLKHLARKPG